MPTRIDPGVGARLGDFVIERRLGAGRWGPLYAGRHALTGRRAALRIIERPELDARFRAAAAVQRPGVARVLGVGDAAGTCFAALEFIEGRSLDRILEDRTRLTPAEAVLVTRQLAATLVLLHRSGLAHGALGPTAVFLTRDGTVKATDFGLADGDAAGDLRALGALMLRMLGGEGSAEMGSFAKRLLEDAFDTAQAALKALSAMQVEDEPLPAPPPDDPAKLVETSFGSLAALGGADTMLDMQRPESEADRSTIVVPAAGTMLDMAPPAAPVDPHAPTAIVPTPGQPRRYALVIAGAVVGCALLWWVLAWHRDWAAANRIATRRAALAGEARRAFDAGDWAGSLSACESALANHRDEALEALARRSARRLAQAEVERVLLTGPVERLRGALTSLDAVASHGLDPDLAATLGIACRAVGRLDRAQATLETALAADPRNERLRGELGRAYAEHAAIAALAERYAPFATAVFEDAAAWRLRARELGAPPARVAEVPVLPRSALEWYILGCATSDAAALDRALALDPLFADALVVRAVGRLEAGRLKDAQADSEEAVRMRPGLRSARFVRGKCRLAGGDAAGAESDFSWVLARDPRDAQASLLRAQARAARGALPEAIRDLDHAAALDSRAPDVWALRAHVRHRLGDRRGAAADVRRALAVAPPAWNGRDDAAQLLDRIGR